MIAPSVILPYDSTHASIPSGYTRETSLDGKYPKGTANATNPNTTGGASTHSHTSSSHTHTLVSHTHTGSLGTTNSGGEGGTGSGYGLPNKAHTHSYTSSANTTATSNGVAVSYASVSNDPPYYTVIFIKASSYTLIPNNAMVFTSATTRAGLAFHSASANKFLKGAGTGANAGGTGGTTTNVHNINHNHNALSHNHPVFNSDIANNYPGKFVTDTPYHKDFYHVHPVTFNASSQSFNAYTNLTTTETVQPAYRTLNAFKNTSGSSKMPAVGDIALWLGTLATIPVGWKLCDGSDGTPDMRGRYYKNPSSASASATGGSNTHTHAAQGHTHTASKTHIHTGSSGDHTGGTTYDHDGSGVTIYREHWHTPLTCSTSAPGLSSANTSANSSSNEPEYRTVAFIQFEFPPVMPNPILKMLIDTVENWG